jgi:hypothetical protein
MWSAPISAIPSLEARGVLSAGSKWLVGNIVKQNDLFYTLFSLVTPTKPTWQEVATDMSPVPDGSVLLARAVEGADGAIHMVKTMQYSSLDGQIKHNYVRYVRFNADGTITSAYVSCSGVPASIALLSGDQPVILFTPIETGEKLLSFGPKP